MTGRSLDGKVALVTGASRGVGHATAVELARLGANVAVTARTVRPRGDDLTGTIHETASAVEDVGAQALPIAADLRLGPDRSRVVRDTLDAFGRIDILVNNAADTGDNVFRGFWETTTEEWAAQIDLNLNAMYDLMRECAPDMRRHGGGLIVNVGSAREVPEGLTGGGGRIFEDIRLGAAYPTSKVAVFAMSTLVAQELAEDNIAVVTMTPGPAMSESFVHNAERFGWDPSVGTPVDLPARTVAFLATCPDPMSYAATYVDAVSFAEEHQLTGPD